MNLNIYNLMYVDLNEKRYLSGRIYDNEERLDLYVKGCCVLDKTLKINNFSGGVKILTNHSTYIRESLKRLHYEQVEVIDIPFDLDVPQGIPFYSAHFKIDVFRYFSTLSDEEYSILLDSDVVCMKPFGPEFEAIVNEGLPMVYYLNGYGGLRKLSDVNKILPEFKWILWAGGEFIGGTADFYDKLYKEIISFKDYYWKLVNDRLFHVGDEMLTSIALQRLRKYNVFPVDVQWLGFIHRYWSVYESKSIFKYNCPLLHLPGDKVFEKKINLEENSLDKLFRGYSMFHAQQRIKQMIRQIIK